MTLPLCLNIPKLIGNLLNIIKVKCMCVIKERLNGFEPNRIKERNCVFYKTTYLAHCTRGPKGIDPGYGDDSLAESLALVQSSLLPP